MLPFYVLGKKPLPTFQLWCLTAFIPFPWTVVCCCYNVLTNFHFVSSFWNNAGLLYGGWDVWVLHIATQLLAPTWFVLFFLFCGTLNTR